MTTSTATIPTTPPADVISFIGAIFEPTDRVTIRPIETWNENGKKHSRVAYKETRYPPASILMGAGNWWRELLADTEREKANVFFGVCPRFGEKGKFDLAWQIRTVRVLWADLDHCTPDEARERCKTAGIPAPSIIIASGNGVHLYWILTEPFLIDDVGDPMAVEVEWIETDKLKDDGTKKKKKVPYCIDPTTGARIEERDFPKVSARGLHVQHVLAGIASKIGGDHTIDLARLLRLPCTMNRKDERNGKVPVECVLVECDATRRYPFAEFETFATAAPDVVKAAEVAKINLRSGMKLTAKRRNKLSDLLNACSVVQVGARSEPDFAALCWAIEQGLDKSAVWAEAQKIGKFAERGEDYFDLTWKNAQAEVRTKIHDKITRKAGVASANGKHDGDGDENGTSAHGDNRPIIDITTDEHKVNAAALKALAKDARVFRRDGVGLVRIVQADEPKPDAKILTPKGTPQIRALPPALIREWLCANAIFRQVIETDDGQKITRKPPPSFCVDALDNRGEWVGIRRLEGVVDYPVLRPDGTILDTPGYDVQTGLVFNPAMKFSVIPTLPTANDIETAKADLLDIVTDFPFGKDTHRATYVAAILNVLARSAFTGPSPLFLIDANTAGSGKGLLVNVVTIVTTGRDASIMSNTDNDEEVRKRITALAIGGDRLILIDNIDGPLGSAALDAALTSTTWKDRILGRNEMVEMPLMPTWFATGNNVVLLSDTSRRVAHSRLETKEENPEEREGFKYPNLLEHVRRHRGRYLAAGLTILRGYCVAGRPDQHLKTWGSFEGWSSLVRSSVVWCGLPDPGETRVELRERADNDGKAMRAIFAGIEFMTKNGITVSEMIDGFIRNPTYRDAPLMVAIREAFMMTCKTTRGSDFPSPNSIGMKLHHLQGRIVDGHRLVRGTRDHTAVWSVEKV